jgi:hypothetical protein
MKTCRVTQRIGGNKRGRREVGKRGGGILKQHEDGILYIESVRNVKGMGYKLIINTLIWECCCCAALICDAIELLVLNLYYIL